ncbi:MAG: ADP-ribosylation factor-like protein [Promethearchaeia archaeon]
MRKTEKILFTGKPNAGKTTLIKAILNGESTKKLLDYLPPNPTYGCDIQEIDWQKKIGVFDLSGKENKRWFRSEDRSIFYNASEIIAVIDVTTPKNEIMDFSRKLLKLRNEFVPNVMIHILVHKIDLVNAKEFAEIKNFMEKNLKTSHSIEIHFTSIKKDYFLSTFRTFIEILKELLKRRNLETDQDQMDFLFLKNVLTIVKIISLKKEINEKELCERANISLKRCNKITNLLLRKNHIKSKKTDNGSTYTLTEKGQKHIQRVLKTVSLKDFKTLDSNILSSILPQKEEIPPFAGALIADKDGKTIYILESENNLLENTLKETGSKKNGKFDIQLIPMFVSALETFSKEINIENITGLSLEGNRLRMQVFSYEEFTVTCFFNSNIDVKKISKKIEKHFEYLLRRYGKKLKEIISTCKKAFLPEFQSQGEIWINKINKRYKNFKENLEVFDFDIINSLYKTLDKISELTQKGDKRTIEKIRGLKKHLLKAAVEENEKELRRINKSVEKIKKMDAVRVS